MARILRRPDICILLLMLTTPYVTNAFLGSITIAAGAITGFIGVAYNYLHCEYEECCTSKWLKADFKGLQHKFHHEIYGQHLVNDMLVNVLCNHLKNSNPSKALVVSFHGPTGTGKSFVSRMIADHLFVNGMKSRFFHFSHSTLDFLAKDHVEDHKSKLRQFVRFGVSQCERSIFVFEDVHVLPRGVLDAIYPFLDSHEIIEGHNFRKSIYIFLSNTGATRITKAAFNAAKEGRTRESIVMSELQSAIAQDAFRNPGGFQNSILIEKSSIDYYVPFFPLERRHVALCIREVLVEMEIHNFALVEHALNELDFDSAYDGMYSTFGCRSLEKAVMIALAEMNIHLPPRKQRKGIEG